MMKNKTNVQSAMFSSIKLKYVILGSSGIWTRDLSH